MREIMREKLIEGQEHENYKVGRCLRF